MGRSHRRRSPSGMAGTAHKDPEMTREYHDSPQDLAEKVDRLAEMVRSSQHFVVFTGAGVSTSAGIPDFRGPTGKWTREAQGLKPLKGVSAVQALPTLTHMALVELHKRDVLKYLISQNCDGLHRRSGIPATAISELHGNGNAEVCEDCGARYFRDFKCDRMEKKFDHFTGRFCRCKGRLLNCTIDFGQTLEPTPLRLAQEHSSRADLHLAMGSSLAVSPANTQPETTGRKPDGNLVICNLQKTPLTSLATFQIFAETDVVMQMLMERLDIPVPPWRLLRRVIVGVTQTEGRPPAVFAKTVDIHDPTLEIGVLRGVDWDGTGLPREADEHTEAIVAAMHGGHRRAAAGLDLASLEPTLHFVGNYQEPCFQICVDLVSTPVIDCLLSFDPETMTWECLSQRACESISTSVSQVIDGSYGSDHREYCINGVMEKYGKTRGEAEKLVEQRAQEARDKALRALPPGGRKRSPGFAVGRGAVGQDATAGRGGVRPTGRSPGRGASGGPANRGRSVPR